MEVIDKMTKKVNLFNNYVNIFIQLKTWAKPICLVWGDE